MPGSAASPSSDPADLADDPPATGSGSPPRRFADMQPRNPSLLLVEPSPPVADAIIAALGRRGITADSASALPAAPALVPPLIVADLHRVETAALRDLSTAEGTPPRWILLCEDPRPEDYRRALRLGALDLIAKPFRVDELVRTIETLPPPLLPPTTGGRSRTEPAPPGVMRRTYQSNRDASVRAARDVAAFCLRCAASPTTRARIASACVEVVDNAVRHAYPDAPGPIDLELVVDPREAFLCVVDEGRGFDPLEDSCVEHGGLARAAAYAEGIDISATPGGGTRVSLRFRIARAELADECSLDLSELDFFTPEVARSVLDRVRGGLPEDDVHLSPALAVLVGRLLSGPDLRRAPTFPLRP